ncbi:MAG: cysteine desulfurase family protein [Sphaerimonospora mesophila]
MIYLDYAAATPLDPRVLKTQEPYFAEQFFNPSASYLAAQHVRADYEAARHRLAQTIGARPAEVIMTAGATESINLALNGVEGKILTTNIEHPAVLATTKARDGMVIPVDNKGRVDPSAIESFITDDVALISIGYANSEIGTVQPIKEIASVVARARERRLASGINRPLLFHTDASQAAGYLDINTARLGVDLMTLNAGKCYGPKQVGLLYVRAGIMLKPLVHGGGQEMGLRSGTENVAGTIGFALALELAEKKRKGETERLAKFRDGLEAFLTNEFSQATINGHRKHRLPNILNISISGLDGERALFALDQAGVMVATGSACAANKGTRSHVLTAIGLEPVVADGSLRISLGRPTTEAEIAELQPILARVIREQLKFGFQNV